MNPNEHAERILSGAAKTIFDGRPYTADTAVTFRVTSGEKIEMKDVAVRLGLSVTDYLLRLHRAAKALADSER